MKRSEGKHSENLKTMKNENIWTHEVKQSAKQNKHKWKTWFFCRKMKSEKSKRWKIKKWGKMHNQNWENKTVNTHRERTGNTQGRHQILLRKHTENTGRAQGKQGTLLQNRLKGKQRVRIWTTNRRKENGKNENTRKTSGLQNDTQGKQREHRRKQKGKQGKKSRGKTDEQTVLWITGGREEHRVNNLAWGSRVDHPAYEWRVSTCCGALIAS